MLQRISLFALTLSFLVSCSSDFQPPGDDASVPAGPTVHSTVTNSAIAMPSSTPAEIATPRPDFGHYWISERTFPSPDRSSTASILTAHPRSGAGDYYVRLEAHANHVVIDEWRQGGLGYTTPTVLGWSADAKALYIATSTVPDGCAPFDLLSNVRSVSIPYGSPESVPLEVKGPLSLSPDGSRIAGVQDGGLVLYSLDGELVAETGLTLEESDRAGSIVWTPSLNRLGFVIQRNACNGEVRSEILVASTPHLEVRQVAEFTGQRVWTAKWIGERMLVLREQFGDEVILDTQTERIYGP